MAYLKTRIFADESVSFEMWVCSDNFVGEVYVPTGFSVMCVSS
jgi:hypothetical protein